MSTLVLILVKKGNSGIVRNGCFLYSRKSSQTDTNCLRWGVCDNQQTVYADFSISAYLDVAPQAVGNVA